VPTVALGRARLHYEERGAGTPVLGIHGTPGSAALWEDAARDLSRHGRCITYDRRGFGRSPLPDGTTSLDLDDHVDDALALLDALAARPAVVVGRSSGGVIALALALREPSAVLGLALLEPSLVTVDLVAAAWATRLRERVIAAEAVEPGSAARTVVVGALGDGVWDAWPARLRDVLTRGSPAVLAEARGEGLDLSPKPLVVDRDALAALPVPVLLVSGEDSPAPLRAVVARLAAAMPDATSVVVPGGHLIDPARPEILAFVARLTV
jgi:pimeloyl-ACP methyl ester carboxylesterase